MKRADQTILAALDRRADERRNAIRNAPTSVNVTGKRYYVSNDGDDKNDGTAENRAWKTLARASDAEELRAGDGVFFRRGDLFRGSLQCRAGVTYSAFGSGEKPRFYGWRHDLADPALWEVYDKARHIYHLTEAIPDCGTLVFDHGAAHSRKLIPSYIGGKFVCREDHAKDFVIADEMTDDLDLFCSCTARMTERPSHDETFPIPQVDPDNCGDLYLRCDAGNPGEVFSSIEACVKQNAISVRGDGVTIDNLCIKYSGAHAIGAGGSCVRDLTVTNCEIGWIGGSIQHYLGTDPNYPNDVRGNVTRYGNGIEIYGGCDGYRCENNYIYQIYDAGVTHQVTVGAREEAIFQRNIRYVGNLIEYCVYSIEYFLSKVGETGSTMENVEIADNILRFSGYGWGQQRHNKWTPAHIKSWTFENPARNYSIRGNLFDRAKYRLLHLCAETSSDYPIVDGNTYVQTYGRTLGQFGAIEGGIPPVLAFFEASDRDIENAIGDKHATVYYLPED